MPTTDDAEEKDDGFLMMNDYLMIYRGSVAYDSKRCQKLMHYEVYTAEPAAPTFLRWSESTITFDQTDHPECILQPG